MPKWIENTLNGKNEKTLRETCIMSVFDLSIKSVKRMNNTLYGETEQYCQKTCFLSVMT